MSIDVFSMECDALDGAKLAGWKGVEVLNRPFEFDVFFTVPVGTDVRRAVGARATLTADRADDRGPMCWQGILAGVRLLHETGERALYRASLVPKLWLLGQHVRSFVHTKKKIDAYVRDTLRDGGLTGGDFEFKTNVGAYPDEEFVCQYRESHLDFVHRWLEREGVYYYFEHPEGAGAAEKVVIVDDKAQHGPLLGDGHVRYFPAADLDGSAGECLRELSADFRLLPASVLVTDYNYGNPAAPIAGEKPVMNGGQGKIREYGYRVFSEGEAKRLAQVKAQSIACRELLLTASGTYLGLRAGYTFEVDEGPSDLPSRYLAIEVRHAGVVSGASALVMRYTGLSAKETYRVDVTAIPADTQYRAPQSTPWPRIYGFENGTVDGPGDSQYAQIDDHGRYLVRFKFDASELPDGSTSTYLRMMQPHGGSTEGFHFPLRKGTEVMVSFQGGDPDRPLIAGVVPNAHTPSNVTNRNHTQNIVKTGGGNYMVMEDKQDQEFIDMATPLAKTRQFLGKREFVQVTVPPDDPTKAPEDELIEATYHVTTEGNAVFSVDGHWYEGIGGSYYVDVGGFATVHYGGKSTFIVDGVSTEHYLSTRNTTVTAGRVDKVLGGGILQDLTGKFDQTVRGDYEVTIVGSGKQTVISGWEFHVGSKNYCQCGEWAVDVTSKWKTVAGGSIDLISTGGNIALAAMGGAVTIISPTQINLVAPAVNSTAARDLVETFGKKWEAGIHSGSATAFTNDIVGVATEHKGITLEIKGVAVEARGFYKCQDGTELKGVGASIASGAVRALSFGLLKL